MFASNKIKKQNRLVLHLWRVKRGNAALEEALAPTYLLLRFG